ncbi:TlpA disulfide reductase family protein [Castellaniella denitrificans]|uniref:TlpA disulfide reductase family protein n=1 Tax=Castellaniella denitrificans TaxID=56119 RepID=A0ABT4LZC9_9BURK|nr:TlpA disulfide reductase family protein [Castellaniella denitrificans]MCZ4328416.1 TlpA disulfide reductase family protein [Castellaniella denitrificans]
MRTTSLAALGVVAGARGAGASILPADPVFGRSFADLQGHDQALSAYVGRPVLMNFWASWCAPCVREMPLLETLHQRHPDLSVLGLAIDTRVNVERFLQKVTVTYPLLLTGTQGIPLMRELGNKGGGLPFTLLFDRNGRVADSVMGELKPDDIQARLTQIL